METYFEQKLNTILLVLLGLFLLTGTIFFLRWNLQNDEKRNQKWQENLSACGVSAYQNEQGTCIKINNQ